MTKQSLKHKSPCLVLNIKHECWHLFTNIRQDAVIMCGHSSSHTEAVISECWLSLFELVMNCSCDQPFIGITRLKKDPVTIFIIYNLYESAKQFRSAFYFLTKHCQFSLFLSHAIPSFPRCFLSFLVFLSLSFSSFLSWPALHCSFLSFLFAFSILALFLNWIVNSEPMFPVESDP